MDICDEDEDWDERDKAEYERNKQFEKLTADIKAIKEKKEKMQLAFLWSKGWMIVSTRCNWPFFSKIDFLLIKKLYFPF